MTLHDMLEDIPYHRLLAIYDLLGALDSLDDATLDELADDERLIKFGSHKFGDTALMHFKFGADDDHRTSGIVDTLTEEVLTETTLLTLQAIG